MGQSKLLIFSSKSFGKYVATRIFRHLVANSSFCTSVLTKPLARVKFEYFKEKLGVLQIEGSSKGR